MTRRFPANRVERRSLTRGTPESHLLEREGDGAFLDGLHAERCPVRDALVAAFNAYGRRYGWREAKCWAASRAHYDPKGDGRAQQVDAPLCEGA